MTLLAFDDMSKSKLADLVENSQKVKVASEVNHQLLKSQSKDTGRSSNLNIEICRIENFYFDETTSLVTSPSEGESFLPNNFKFGNLAIFKRNYLNCPIHF